MRWLQLTFGSACDGRYMSTVTLMDVVKNVSQFIRVTQAGYSIVYLYTGRIILRSDIPVPAGLTGE